MYLSNLGQIVSRLLEVIIQPYRRILASRLNASFFGVRPVNMGAVTMFPQITTKHLITPAHLSITKKIFPHSSTYNKYLIPNKYDFV